MFCLKVVSVQLEHRTDVNFIELVSVIMFL